MRYIKIAALAALALLIGAGPAAAKVDVVAATQDLAWVARAVGGSQVSVDYLAGSNQDPHAIEPRPSQVVKLARADLVVRVGLDLDIWFDALIRAAGSSKITLGSAGYVDASRGVRLLQVPSGKLDPSMGDIHVFGNPHYLYGPSNLPVVARNIRDGLKRVDRGNSAAYDSNYNALIGRLNEAMQRWKAKMAPERGKNVVTYHQSLIYFLTDFGIREFANVEPRPGLEPTVGHVTGVGRSMKGAGVRAILTEGWRSRRYADLLARQSGAQVVVLPGGVGAERGIDDYFSLIDAWVNRISGAL
ncbi:MAG TPA: metal ABC transporter substrate-binding protein [Armatimonadota bacterium]|nr:metal ABC transporter substrate-binding protein [Armatimonadota bacterium]